MPNLTFLSHSTRAYSEICCSLSDNGRPQTLSELEDADGQGSG